MKKHSPVILIVLESVEPDLLDLWINEGHLPTLKKLRQNGAWGRITSPAYISSGCVWPSLTVGVNPGKHGFGFFHRQLKNGTYRIIKKYADDIPVEYFWIPLSRAGKKVAIMDVPITRPEKELNGCLFCNWGDEHPGWKPDSKPKDLLPEIIKKFGQHPLHEWYQFNPSSNEDWIAFRDQLQKGVEARTEVSKFVLQKEKWDMAIINYGESHWSGHMAWHIHDENHPQHDPQLRKECGNIILENYKDLDNGVSEIIKDQKDATVMVLSHIGMKCQTGGELLTTEILKKLGLSGTDSKPGAFKKIKNKIFPGSQGVSAAVQNVEKVIPPSLITKIKKFFPERLWDDWSRRYLSMGTNWANSKAFLVPGDHASLIRINLKGREPKGKVSPGVEYSALCKQIAEAFYELREVSTGKPVVTRIEFLKDTLWGDYVDELPDMAIIWRDGPPIEAVESEKLGRIELQEYHKRSGGHSEHGFFIMHGPDIKKGVEIKDADTLDIVPTIFSILKETPPDYLDGVSLINKVTEPQNLTPNT
jgi:predicted AlkP superfamily phosphohydrolase/phosphomutase